MEELKDVISANIIELRHRDGYTQAELAEKLNYSDKAVSKWERGESLPDISVLKAIADMFKVSVDYLLSSDHKKETETKEKISRRTFRNRTIITFMSILLVFFIATAIFVNVDLINITEGHWLTFVYAIPIGFIVWLVFNSIWFNPHRNFLIVSLLMWSALTAVFLTLTVYTTVEGAWLLYVIGIPAQIIIILWSGIRRSKNKGTSTE